MLKRKTVSIVLYGNVNIDNNDWVKWYNYSKNQSIELGYPPNYIGIIGQSFTFGKIYSLQTVEKKLKKSLESGEKFDAISIYFLPNCYKQAAFDYDLYLTRTTIGRHPHIILTVLAENFSSMNVDCILEKLKEHIEFSSGQIFEMFNNESPQFYAAKVNSSKSFKSLIIIKDLSK